MTTSTELVTLYQTEWCPFSSAVREVLTELGIDVIVRQVEPWPDQREHLREVAGTDLIPVLQTEDGQIFRGTREIFAHLRSRKAWRHAAAHRQRYADHRDARESDATGQLLEYFRGTGDLEPLKAEASDGRRIGLLAYRQRDNRVAITHTEVSPTCQGRGFGGRLAAAALDDLRRRGLLVVPLCPFIGAYIQGHPEYRDLVAPEHRRPHAGS